MTLRISKSLLGLLLVMLVFAGSAQAEEVKTTMARISLPEYGVSVEVPSHWKFYKREEAADGWSDTTYLGFYGFKVAGLTVSGGQWDRAMTFDEFAASYQPSNPAITVLNRQNVTVSGQDYVELTCAFNDGKHDLDMMIYVTINGTTGTNFTYYANHGVYDKVKPDFAASIASVEFN